MRNISKPMAKDNNSKFKARNDKQDIFSKLAKATKRKTESDKKAADVGKPSEDNTK